MSRLNGVLKPLEVAKDLDNAIKNLKEVPNLRLVTIALTNGEKHFTQHVFDISYDQGLIWVSTLNERTTYPMTSVLWVHERSENGSDEGDHPQSDS